MKSQFARYEQTPLLTNEGWRAMLSRHLNSADHPTELDRIAFVFLPTHFSRLQFLDHRSHETVLECSAACSKDSSSRSSKNHF